MTTTHAYFARLHSLLEEIEDSQSEAIAKAASVIAAVIARGDVVHIFGSGHSHIIAEEAFYRAGGLMAVDAMLDPNLTVFGLLRASLVERIEGYAPAVLASYDVRPGEAVIVVSNSGINPVPIEMAIGAKQRGATVIALTSAANYVKVATRHSSGATLAGVADLVIDTHVPLGDATVDLDDHGTRMGAASTVLGAAVINAIVVEAAAALQRAGSRPPVIVSMNVPGGDDRNSDLVERYRPRLRALRD
jgi:uncharacterized phosphosugar-binding protein